MMIQEDKSQVENRLKLFEQKTGCDLLLVVCDECDPYPAASWRFGVTSSFIIGLTFSYYFDFHLGFLWPLGLFLCTLLFSNLTRFKWAKRLALSDWETLRETKEKAIELFHTLGTNRVSHGVTAMIMVSLLEKKIHVLVDEQLKEKISQLELDELVMIMQKHMKKNELAAGLIESIESLENKIILDFGGKVSEADLTQLSDTIHFIQST